MKKSEIKVRMREGFSELSPDLFEQIMKAAEQEKPVLQEMETEITEKHLEHKCPDDSAGTWTFWKGTVCSGSFSKYAISACASLVLFCVFLFGMFGKNQNEICLIMDINPSIQIVMNDSLQVKRLKGLNQDGRDVIKKLKWNKKEPLFDTLDSVIEGAVKDSYLKKNGGILVTVCLSDSKMYEKLEGEMGKNIDRKLKEIGISGIITAFQQGEKDFVEEGRSILEKELTENYGMDAGQMQQMSVMDLIRCGYEKGISGVTFSPESDRQWNEISRQKKEQEEKNKKKQKDSSADETRPQKTEQPGVKPESEKVEDNKADEQQPENGKKEKKVA